MPGVSTIGGEVVLDPLARTYSFVAGPGERYVTVDLDTGAVASDVPILGWFNGPQALP